MAVLLKFTCFAAALNVMEDSIRENLRSNADYKWGAYNALKN